MRHPLMLPLKRLGRTVTGEFGVPLQIPLDLVLMTQTGTATGAPVRSVRLVELLSHGLAVIAVGDLGHRRSRRWLTRMERTAVRLEQHGVSVVAIDEEESVGPAGGRLVGPLRC